jgi:superfamily II DNA or RNA helicase
VNFDTLRLRPYQREVQQAILAARDRGFRSQLVSLATGLGKSVVIATLPKLLDLRAADIALVIAHREELIQQLVEKLRAQNPGAVVGIEKAEDRAPDNCAIVVATVQTLAGARLEEFLKRFGRRIALFVIDEAHHAAAPTYRAILSKILQRRPDALVLGFTATPSRGDGALLIDDGIFHQLVYQMDARAAIMSGYLVPIRSYAVSTDIDIDGVATRGGDFEAVDTEQRNRLIIDAYTQFTPHRKALVFAASVEHARNVAELFLEAGYKAAFASGETPSRERERIVRDFRGTRVDVLVNCGLYLEGFDVPSIEVILNARPTKSATLYTQITGRGMRPLDDYAYVLSELPSAEARREVIAQSPKPYGIVIDIVDQARRHQVVTLPYLWGMPSQVNAEGWPISQVAERYEELFRRAPREAARVRSAEQIESVLIDLDEAAMQQNGPAAAWQMVSPEHWRFEAAPERTARDRRGRIIPHFQQHFEKLVAAAKQIAPHENAEAFAMRSLNVDRRAVRLEALRFDAVFSGEGWAVTMSNGSPTPKEIGVADNLPLAFKAVDDWRQARSVIAEPQERPAVGNVLNARRRFRRRRKPVPA